MKETLNKELKEELDAYFFQYSAAKPETIYMAIEILEYARDMLTDVRTESEILFEIDKNAGNFIKIEELKKERELALFFDILDNFLMAASKNSIEIQGIPDKQKSLYIEDIKGVI